MACSASPGLEHGPIHDVMWDTKVHIDVNRVGSLQNLVNVSENEAAVQLLPTSIHDKTLQSVACNYGKATYFLNATKLHMVCDVVALGGLTRVGV
jgi:hypothetical protein